MIVVVAKYLIPKGYRALTVFPLILLSDKSDRSDRVLINHERIHIRQQLELLGMARLDHGAVAPGECAPGQHAPAGQRFDVDPSGGKGRKLLALDADGEVAAPVFRKIEMEAWRLRPLPRCAPRQAGRNGSGGASVRDPW